MITVVAALIAKDGKILIAKRNYGNEEVVNKWEFPGGKLESTEDEFQAIEREIREEFEITVKAKRFLTSNIYSYPSRTINLKLYECEYISGEMKLTDHSEFKYIYPQEIVDYKMCPADIELARYVSNMQLDN